MKTITMNEIMKCSSWGVKDNSTRGVHYVTNLDVKIGDKVAYNNSFYEVVEAVETEETEETEEKIWAIKHLDSNGFVSGYSHAYATESHHEGEITTANNGNKIYWDFELTPNVEKMLLPWDIIEII